jgi:hypothetical protein
MQSAAIRQIKAALWEQAFIGCTRVSCPLGNVVAVRRRKGQLLVLLRGGGALVCRGGRHDGNAVRQPCSARFPRPSGVAHQQRCEIY